MEQAWLQRAVRVARHPERQRRPGARAATSSAPASGSASACARPAARPSSSTGRAQPLAVGEIRASSGAEAAPTVLCYGHFDVQPPAPLELWDSPPFEATVRDGWLYGRGVADDKGQLYLLLKAAEQLAAEGALPVNLRFACDGEEETGGHSIVDFLAADERGADACVIFDSDMVARGRPAFNVATRGLCYFHLTRPERARATCTRACTAGPRSTRCTRSCRACRAVLPRDGRLPEPLRAGIVPPSEEELASWASLPAGLARAREPGCAPADARGGGGVLPSARGPSRRST